MPLDSDLPPDPTSVPPQVNIDDRMHEIRMQSLRALLTPAHTRTEEMPAVLQIIGQAYMDLSYEYFKRNFIASAAHGLEISDDNAAKKYEEIHRVTKSDLKPWPKFLWFLHFNTEILLIELLLRYDSLDFNNFIYPTYIALQTIFYNLATDPLYENDYNSLIIIALELQEYGVLRNLRVYKNMGYGFGPLESIQYVYAIAQSNNVPLDTLEDLKILLFDQLEFDILAVPEDFVPDVVQLPKYLLLKDITDSPQGLAERSLHRELLYAERFAPTNNRIYPVVTFTQPLLMIEDIKPTPKKLLDRAIEENNLQIVKKILTQSPELLSVSLLWTILTESHVAKTKSQKQKAVKAGLQFLLDIKLPLNICVELLNKTDNNKKLPNIIQKLLLEHITEFSDETIYRFGVECLTKIIKDREKGFFETSSQKDMALKQKYLLALRNAVNWIKNYLFACAQNAEAEEDFLAVMQAEFKPEFEYFMHRILITPNDDGKKLIEVLESKDTYWLHAIGLVINKIAALARFADGAKIELPKIYDLSGEYVEQAFIKKNYQFLALAMHARCLLLEKLTREELTPDLIAKTSPLLTMKVDGIPIICLIDVALHVSNDPHLLKLAQTDMYVTSMQACQFYLHPYWLALLQSCSQGTPEFTREQRDIIEHLKAWVSKYKINITSKECIIFTLREAVKINHIALIKTLVEELNIEVCSEILIDAFVFNQADNFETFTYLADQFATQKSHKDTFIDEISVLGAPLMRAALENPFGVKKCTWLIAQNVALDWINTANISENFLHFAIYAAKFTGVANAIKYLNMLLMLPKHRKFLLSHQDTNGDTALHIAVRMQQAGLIVMLVGHGADIAIKNKQDKRPLDLLLQVDPKLEGLGSKVIANLLGRRTFDAKSSGLLLLSQQSRQESSDIKDIYVWANTLNPKPDEFDAFIRSSKVENLLATDKYGINFLHALCANPNVTEEFVLEVMRKLKTHAFAAQLISVLYIKEYCDFQSIFTIALKRGWLKLIKDSIETLQNYVPLTSILHMVMLQFVVVKNLAGINYLCHEYHMLVDVNVLVFATNLPSDDEEFLTIYKDLVAKYESARLSNSRLPAVKDILYDKKDMVLHAALMARAPNKLKYLLTLGCDAGRVYNCGMNLCQLLFGVAAKYNSNDRFSVKTIKELLKVILTIPSAAELVNYRCEKNDYNTLDYAILLEQLHEDKDTIKAIIVLILDAGLELISTNKREHNILHFAGEYGDMEVVSFLLDQINSRVGNAKLGEMLRVKDINGFTPIHAAQAESPERCKLMLSYVAKGSAATPGPAT